MTFQAIDFMRALRSGFFAFCGSRGGNVALTFALVSLPLVTGLGMAVDYSRANATKASVQDALDSAVLAGAKDGGSSWATTAANIFTSNLTGKSISYSTPSFSKSDPYYTGSVSASVPTSILGIVGINNVAVNASSKAMSAPDGYSSCILTLDKGQPTSHVSITLSGAPLISLTGCSMRSNSSMNCSGHDGGATKSYASGSASGCSNPTANVSVVNDVYASMASNITKQCGSTKTGVTWTAGTLPTGSAVKTVSKTGYTEYHICGDLTLSGTGSLFSTAPSGDTVIVVENGSVNVTNGANVTASRTGFVLTGDNNSAAQINFPNGAGKTATLTVSPPSTVGNPWQAVAVYLDPALTKNVDNSWGPGATFNVDGLVYLGNSNLTTNGNAASGASKCTKLVLNSLSTNGSLNMNFYQQNCATLGLKQADAIGSVHLVQ
jgi:hypothetical protein